MVNLNPCPKLLKRIVSNTDPSRSEQSERKAKWLKKEER
jgi:hypothetical protein